jgi:heme exporter protein C
VSRSAIIRSAAWLWFIAALAILAIGFREAIFIAPTEATMGNVQRIFYYHVPSAIMGLIFPYVNFIASLAYLYWRRRDPLKALSADALALASAEVTIVFVSIGLMTGMLWGRASWGIWWAERRRLGPVGSLHHALPLRSGTPPPARRTGQRPVIAIEASLETAP